ncbi:MAG: DNA metabolism protein [Clostridiales bacterium]|nr:DNA metabolism protein [Clostridiales bacterium]
MPERSDIVYVYDGSFEGLLCCIFDSYEHNELPFEICLEDAGQETLYPVHYVYTDTAKANRVKAGIKKKASYDVYKTAELGYYSCHPRKELLISDFVRLGMKHGRKTLSMLADDTVSELLGAVKGLTRESHQLKGFVRFSIYSGVMTAVIEPKNFVLPLLQDHFCDRYASDTFIIYDKIHEYALLYARNRSAITPVYNYKPPDADGEELLFRSLWKLFYDTIAVEERINPRCRMSHMQKRYWRHLTEMDEQNEPLNLRGKKRDGHDTPFLGQDRPELSETEVSP